MANKSKNTLMMITFIILGVSLSLQFRATLIKNNELKKIEFNYDNIQKQVNAEIELAKVLRRELNTLVTSKDRLISTSLKKLGSTENLKKEWLSVRFSSGLSSVRGEGIVIYLKDAPKFEDFSKDNIIHDADIYKIFNELKKAGAQAISINGERIMPTSEVVCNGPTIRVNRNRYPAPFIIQAISNKDILYDSLDKSLIVSQLRQAKIEVNFEKKEYIIIPKFVSNLENITTGLKEVLK